jgi:hypothetical protein
MIGQFKRVEPSSEACVMVDPSLVMLEIWQHLKANGNGPILIQSYTHQRLVASANAQTRHYQPSIYFLFHVRNFAIVVGFCFLTKFVCFAEFVDY